MTIDRVLRQHKHEPLADMGERTLLEVRDSPILATAMEIDYPKRQTRATSEAMKESSSMSAAQSMEPCGHHRAQGKSVAVDCILPSGVQIDCAGCLQNFMKQTDILFTIFQLTFEEQDAERAAHPTPHADTRQEPEIANDRNAQQEKVPAKLPVREAIPPIAKTHSNAKKKGKSVRGRPRTNGRFIPGPRLAFEAPVNVESAITENGTEQLPPPTDADGVINLSGNPEEATASADSLAKQNEISPEESIHVRYEAIHVRALESSRNSTYSWSTHRNFKSPTDPSSCIKEGTQVSTVHASDGSMAIPQDTSTNYIASPPTLALQERNPRKRNLTEKARELLATADTADQETFYTGASKQVGKQVRTIPAATKLEAGDNTSQVRVNSISLDQNIAVYPMEPPSSKRKPPPPPSRAQPPTKRQKTPDVMSPQPPAGKRRPGRPRKPRPGGDIPSTILAETSATTPDTEDSVSGRSVTTRSTSTGSFQQSPTSPFYGPECRLAYCSTASRPPAIPIAPALRLEVSTPEPEKRRRGRPPKVTVEKSMPIALVPIQPKPVANGVTSIPAADVSSGVGYSSQMSAPSEPKRRGRPRKPQITLNRSPVVAPVPLSNAPAGRGFTSMSASLPPRTVPASEVSEASNLTVLSDDPIVKEEAKSPPAAAPSTVASTRILPLSPQKRHINLIVRDSARVLPRPSNAHMPGDSTETEDVFAAQTWKNKDPGPPTTVNDVSKSAALVTSSPLARVVPNESTLNCPLLPPKPASIADAVTNISTDSEPSSSSTSEEDTETDETFHPKRSWVAVNSGSSASGPKSTTRGGGSVGTRGLGCGRGSSPVSGRNPGVRSRGGATKIEKGQQTLGSFFQKPLAVGVAIQQRAIPAAGIERAGPGAKRGGKRETGAGRVKSENVDVEMKDI
ncbi:hypothetical protein EV426DRAFT_574381 [Tirmania nivea]|nr:hypothetical protein EV426DRAFT_574381 [Tirmania nivea]